MIENHLVRSCGRRYTFGMAQYHMNLKYISRGGGKSVAAHAAYISASMVEEERTGLIFDYTQRRGEIISGMLAPESSPEWVHEIESLWNHVENFEDHIAETRFRGNKDPLKNEKSLAAKAEYLETCKTGYQATLALPLEIDSIDHFKELSERIVEECYVKEGLIAQYAIHLEDGNPHLHILATTRAWNGENFSRKRFVIDRAKVVEIRQTAARITNEFAQEKGYNFSVDARSYKDRGIDIEASRHLGPKAFHKYQDKSQIGEENEEVRLQNIELLLQKPQEILKLVASQKPVFTREDIDREVFKRVGGDMNLFSLLKMRLEVGLEKDFGEVLQFDAQVIEEHWRRMRLPEAMNANTSLEERIGRSSLDGAASGTLDGVGSAFLEERIPIVGRSFGFLENVSLFVQRAVSHFLDRVSVNSNTAEAFLTGSLPLTSSEFVQNLLEKANVNREPFTTESLQDHEDILKRFTNELLHSTGVALGQNLRGQEIFTTPEMVELEEQTKTVTQNLKAGTGKVISPELQEVAIAKVGSQENLVYSQEQREAIAHLLEERQIQILTGKAGTGKTTVLKPVVKAYIEAGYIPIGVAFQGKVADLLSHELGIPSFTLDQLRHHWKERESLIQKLPTLWGKALEKAELQIERSSDYLLTDRHVVILDEGNMVGGNLWKTLLDNVASSGAHLRVVQDQKQIKALYGLDISRLVEQEVGAYELKEVFRQKSPWMRECSALLNDHKVEAGLTPYAENGHFAFRETVASAKYALVESYIQDVQTRLSAKAEEAHPISASNDRILLLQEAPMALAFRRADAQELNEGIRTQLKALSHIQEEISYKGQDYGVGDRVFFGQNDHRELFVQTLEGESGRGVRNGTLGVIEAIEPKSQCLSIRLSDGRLMGVDLKRYDALEYGYATTVNKAEGQTYDRVLGLFDPLMDASKTLVWGTRHKTDFRAFVSKTHGETIPEIALHVERAEYRPLLGDFQVTSQNEAAVSLLRKYLSSSQEAARLWTTILKESQEEPFRHELWSDFKAAQTERNDCAGEILNHWHDCAGFARQVGLKRSTLEMQAGVKDRVLTTFEKDALARVEAYRAVASRARELYEEKRINTGDVTSIQDELTPVAALRDAMAYEIATFPEIHKPFFKVTPSDRLSSQKTFMSYAGETYSRRPASWKSCERHAHAYMKAQRDQFYGTLLSQSEKATYQELLEYKAHSHECARLVSLLKLESQKPRVQKFDVSMVHNIEVEKQKELKIQEIKSQLNEITKERGFLAYRIVSHYERYSPHMKAASVSEEKLLTHAVSGELRQSILKYRSAESVTERLEMSHKINGFLQSRSSQVQTQEAINRKAYALTREMGLDPQRIRFEAGAYAHWKKGGVLSYTTVAELQKAYVDLKSHRRRSVVSHSQKIEFSPGEKSEARDRIMAPHQTLKPFFKAEEVETALIQDMTHFADHVFASLGIQPHRGSSSARERRYGKNGHIAVNLKTGAWIDHKDSSLSGGPLSLLTKLKGMNYREAIEYGASWAGLSGETRTLAQSARPIQTPATDPDLKEHDARIQKAKELWERTQPIEGTVAERYLREHRKITGTLSQDLRYLPPQRQQGEIPAQNPAGLLAAARNSHGEIQAVQVTYLDPITGQKADIDVKKRSFGVLKGSAVTLQEDRGHSNTLYVAEGVETSLSLKAAALKGTIVASLGLSNMKHLNLKPSLRIIVCADHDAPDSPALKSLNAVVNSLKEQGHDVQVIKPQQEGQDFNDVIQLQGAQGVQEEIARQLPEDIKVYISNGIQNFSSSLEERFELTPEQTKTLNYKVSKGIPLTDEEKDLIRQLEVQYEKDQQKLRTTEPHSSNPEQRFELTPEQTKTLNYKVSKGIPLTDEERGLIKKLEEQYEKDQKNNMKTTTNSHSMVNTRFELTPEQSKNLNYKVSKGIPLTDDEKELIQKLEAQYKADLKQSQRMAILDRERIDMHNTHEHHHEDLSQTTDDSTTRKRGRSISR